jgi:hypothetical protein
MVCHWNVCRGRNMNGAVISYDNHLLLDVSSRVCLKLFLKRSHSFQRYFPSDLFTHLVSFFIIDLPVIRYCAMNISFSENLFVLGPMFPKF